MTIDFPSLERLPRVNAYLLMARPYSFVDSVLKVLAAHAVAAPGAFSPSFLDVVGVLSLLLLWFGFCWNLEAMHRHENRPSIRKEFAYAAFLAGALCAAVINSLTLVFSLLYFLCALLYSSKEGHSFFLGVTSFLWRGVAQGAAFLLGVLLFTPTLTSFDWLVALAIAFVIAARNLTGDIRDVSHDRSTFPVVYGKRASQSLVALLKLAAHAALTVATGSFLVGLPLSFEAFLQYAHADQYAMHRLSVIGTAAVLANLGLTFFGLSEAIPFLLFVYLSCVLSMFYYEQVPRPTNPVRVRQSG